MKKTVKNLMAVLLCFAMVFGTCVCAFAVGSVSGLGATAEYNSITLSWYSNGDADGYEVYVASGKSWKKLATTKEEYFIHKNLKFNTAYTYRVRAYEKRLFRTVYSKYQAVTAKTALGTVRGLRATSVTENGFKLTWNKVAGATGYQIFLYAGGKWVYQYKTTATYKAVTGAKLGVVYPYRVRAYRTVNGKNYYGPVSATLQAKCAVIAPSGIKAGSVTTSSATLTWKAVHAASGYQVYLKNGSKWVKQANVTANKYTLKGLNPGTKYDVRIRAFRKLSGSYFFSAWVDFSFKTAYKTVKVDPKKFPTTVAEICSTYNAVVNNAKNEKNVTMKVKSSMDIEHVSSLNGFDTSVYMPTDDTITVRNGVAKDQDGNKVDLNDRISPSGRISALKASYVSEASATSTSNGYKITIRLKAEKSTFDGKTTVPAKVHESCLDPIDFADLKLARPEEINSASTEYPGATLVAYVNNSGKLKKLTTTLPFTSTVSCALILNSPAPLTLGLKGKTKDVYDFKY